MIQGVGIGLRSCHYHAILEQNPAIPWFEVLADNYLVQGGATLDYLDAICARYPVVLHGVGLSLGATDPLDEKYLLKLDSLAKRTKAAWISEHLSWGSHGGQHLHDLIPLPYTLDVVNHVVSKIKQVQDTLCLPFLIENISSYAEYHQSTMPESAFVSHVVEESGCGLLLDVNNLYVNAINHGFDAQAYLRALPKGKIKQIHLAGYNDRGTYLYDNHGDHVRPGVWQLYEKALQLFGAVPTLIEWDSDIPSLQTLMAEAKKAEAIMQKISERVT